MRTTLTLDDDLAMALKDLAYQQGASFKEVVNATLRAGLVAKPHKARRYRVKPVSMGLRPGIDLDKALQLAASMEDDETIRKLEKRK